MKVWRLMVWDVPPSLGGLLSRLAFRATKKNPDNWWRVFDPATDRDAAAVARDQLLAAGLKGSWQQIEERQAPTPPHRPRGRHHTSFAPSREGFGGSLNARPIAGTWRRKARRR